MASPIILASIERKINPRRLVNVCPSSDRNLIDSHVVRRIGEKKTNWFVWLRLIGKPQIKRRRRRRFFAGFCAFYWFASLLILVWALNDSPSAASQIRRRRSKEPIKYQLGLSLKHSQDTSRHLWRNVQWIRTNQLLAITGQQRTSELHYRSISFAQERDRPARSRKVEESANFRHLSSFAEPSPSMIW